MFGGTAWALQGGTVDSLSAAYNKTSGKVDISGTVSDLVKDVVIIEILKPNGTLLYFGTANCEDGEFSVSVHAGSLSAGTYKVRSADYMGGEYASAEFTVTKSSNSTGGGPSGPTGDSQDTSAPVAVTTPDLLLVTTAVSGSADTSGIVSYVPAVSEISAAIAKLSAEMESAGKDTALIEIEGQAEGDILSANMTLPGTLFDLLDDSPVSGLRISTPVAQLTFDKEALDTIGDTLDSDVTVYAGTADNSSLSEDARVIVGDRPVYQFLVSGGDEKITNFRGNVTVSVPYTLKPDEDPNAVVIYYIGSEGQPEIVSNCSYDFETGKITFKVTHFSTYAVGYNKVTFNDVPAGASYEEAVAFIAARGITSGTGGGKFEPDSKLTRGQLIVMVMRAYGIKPDTDFTSNFEDAGNDYYTGYLAAAKRLSISNGVGMNRFAPEKSISRQEMYTLLYNTLKAMRQVPKAANENSILDYIDSEGVASWAVTAMEELIKVGVIEGSNGRLNPKTIATRKEMAHVLYELLK